MSTSMRVAFIHPQYPSAEGTGATHSATQIVQGLSDGGHDVDVYCQQEPEKQAASTGLDLYHLSGHSSHPHSSTRVNKEIEVRVSDFSEYDVVHSYLMSHIPSVAKLGRELDVSTVITLNAYGGVCPKNDLRYKDEKQCHRRSNVKCLDCIFQTSSSEGDHGYVHQAMSQTLSLRLINRGLSRLQYIDGFQALSKHVKDIYSDFDFPRSKIQVIPNILDTDFVVEHQSDFSEPYRLLYVGSLLEHKGVQLLPRMVSKLDEIGTYDFELSIVGDGSLRSKIEQESRDLGISSRISFYGQVDNKELPAVYAAHDLFVYPGIWHEPFGRVFIESLAAGTPVIGTNVGSVQSITGAAGIVTNPTSGDLAQKIDQVLTSSKLIEMAEHTQSEIQRFSRTNVIDEFESLYSNI